MTEVERPGELGLVRDAVAGSGDIHVLHLVPHSFGAEDFKLHGSSKDLAGRHQYFRKRKIRTDVFYHRRNVDLLKDKLFGDDLPAYSHILVDGSFTLKDWKYIRQRWPEAKLLFRSHNSELPHRVDSVRAMAVVADTDDMERQEEDRRDVRLNRRVFLDRDLAAAKYADAILAIETVKPTARYWAWLGFRGEVIEVPYFLSKDYVDEIGKQVARVASIRRDWVVCVMSSHPGPVTYHALLRFHEAVTDLGDLRPEWKFRATGRMFWVKNHPAYSSRVKPLGIIDNLYNVISLGKAVAVLSDLGRGFKTKILEAILCKCWVLVNPTLYRRLPEAVKPWCLIVDPDSPYSMDEAIDRVERKAWPEGDPNEALREQAFAAADYVFFGSVKKAKIAGATLSKGLNGSRKSRIAYWSDIGQRKSGLEATFCTVLTPVHKKVASHDWELTRRLNPDCRIAWNVVDNPDVHMATKKVTAFLRQLKTTRGKPDRSVRELYLQRAKEEYYDHGEIEDYMPGAKVLEGWTLAETFDYFASKLRSAPQDMEEHRRLLKKFLASYHHASGLNMALQQVKTRYAVVIDPDLYVIRPNWLSEVINHMTQHDLAVFGVPWNPRWYWKYRYFPCTHLMVIDLEKCPWRQDMLAPDLVRYGQKYISKFWEEQSRLQMENPQQAREHLLKHAALAIIDDVKQRSTIAESGDTGYGLIAEFNRRPDLKFEAAIPVFSLDMGFKPATVTPIQRKLDALLPDRFSYLPKKPGAMSSRGFVERGLPDCRRLGWEEFLWKDEPFAFHVRGELHRKPIGRTDDVEVWNKLNTILALASLPPLADQTWAGADLHATERSSWRYLDKELAEQQAGADGGDGGDEASSKTAVTA